MKVRYLKYLLALTLPLTVAVSFSTQGWLTFLPLLYFYGLVPAAELILRPDPRNLSDAEAELRREDSVYDYLLYLIVPIQYGFLIWFLLVMAQPDLSWATIVGRISAMGLMCGSFGINVAHELGHRSTKHEQWMSKALLLTSLYMHFFIEHNRGHHRNVATPEDPATARKNEWLHTFLIRSVVYSYLSAWQIELASLKRKGIHPLSLKNEMLRFLLIQVGLLIAIALLFSPTGMLYFAATAGIGIFLLETVNYVEHYGLVRHEVSPGKYERTTPHHSWNSDHIIGRLMLFELSRHSDHHYVASKKYQVLEHYDDSPQMPTGYPGMIVLACIPPLWFRVMNPRVDHWSQRAEAIAA
jgi:alkane 1-monooxygenase